MKKTTNRLLYKIILSSALLVMLVIFGLNAYSVLARIKLNISALQLAHQINAKSFIPQNAPNFDLKIPDTEKCHYHWLSGIKTYYTNDVDRSLFRYVLKCLPEGMEMTQFLFPVDIELAEDAFNINPTDIENAYWLLDSVENDDKNNASQLAGELIQRFPGDSVLWRRSGALLWGQGEYNRGLQAFINACQINDGASNGCYYVGALYRALGKPLEAIKYFRLSCWPPSWVEADKLEAQIASGEIEP